MPTFCNSAVSCSAAVERLLAAILPGIDHRRQNLIEPRHAARALRRPIRAAIKRLQLGRQKHAHRPAAVPREHLHRVHVNLIEVRPLLAIDFDRHEVLIEHASDRFVLKALVLHHVAPVTGRVPDRKKDRLVLAPRLLDRLFAPRIPIHRIVLVLQQIRARFLGEAIRHQMMSLAISLHYSIHPPPRTRSILVGIVTNNRLPRRHGKLRLVEHDLQPPSGKTVISAGCAGAL